MIENFITALAAFGLRGHVEGDEVIYGKPDGGRMGSWPVSGINENDPEGSAEEAASWFQGMVGFFESYCNDIEED